MKSTVGETTAGGMDVGEGVSVGKLICWDNGVIADAINREDCVEVIFNG